MRTYTTKQAIRDALMKSMKTGNGIYTVATSMESGRHHWYLSEDGKTHCYGQGLGWSDQGDECSMTLDELVDHLWKIRKHIIEDEWTRLL